MSSVTNFNAECMKAITNEFWLQDAKTMSLEFVLLTCETQARKGHMAAYFPNVVLSTTTHKELGKRGFTVYYVDPCAVYPVLVVCWGVNWIDYIFFILTVMLIFGFVLFMLM